jgi:hypothetical protein
VVTSSSKSECAELYIGDKARSNTINMATRISLPKRPPLKAFFLFGSSRKLASYLINKATSRRTVI